MLKSILTAGAISVVAGHGAVAPREARPGADRIGAIAGRVIDAESHRPIAAAQVEVIGTRRGTITNDSGYYHIVDLPAGMMDVRAVSIGYDPILVSDVRVMPSDTVELDFALYASRVEIDDLVIYPDTFPLVPRDSVKRTAIALPLMVDVTIAGRVLDTESGQPVAAAHVEVIGTNHADRTGCDGYYAIRNVTARTLNVRASAVGYRQVTIPYQRGEHGDTLVLDFALRPIVALTDGTVMRGAPRCP